MKNREKFIEDVGMMNAAAVGVVFIRTREPFRAQDAVREYAYVNKRNYKQWSMLNGWASFNASNSEEPPQFDSEKDLYKALDKVSNVSGSSPSAGNSPDRSTGFPRKTTLTVMWPHFMIPKVPAIMQVLVELATICIEEEKRILLIVPPTFEIPAELTDVIPIIDFDLPSREEIMNDFEECLGDMKVNERPVFSDADTDRIVNALAGMTSSEIEAANARAIVKHKKLIPNIPVDKFVETILAVKTEALKRSDVLELMAPDNMGNVGGFGELKAWVAKRKGAFGREARAAGVDRPRGFLFVGPPGVGKSLAAKATANELGLSLIKFDISRVYSSLVGSTEARVRTALKTLEAMAPAVVLIDEIDKAVGAQSSTNDSGVSTRVLGAILTFMQESKAELFFVMTANRATNLPSELVRKGRLDEVFSAMMPAEDEIREIMGIHLAKRKIDIDTIADIKTAVAAAAGYVGSEIEAAIGEAKLLSHATGAPVTGQSIAEHLAMSKPLSVAFADDFAAMETWASNNARPSSIKAAEGAASRASGGGQVARTRTRPGRMNQISEAPTSTNDLDG